jgi:hypothetical protein
MVILFQVFCVLIAALLHYLYLAVFCLMLAQSVEIGITLAVVFASKSRVKQLLAAAWGTLIKFEHCVFFV